ncbi:calmodulin-binding-domain-containing protein [Obelidium mucronatum]|nr:calmodulin-binding-domain-containing protein [Obelidium mucronatum]
MTSDKLPPLGQQPKQLVRASSAASSKASRSSKTSLASAAAATKQTNNEAARIRIQQMSGSSVAMALKPSRGMRDDIVYAGGKPKDHLKENYKKLKELQSKKRVEEQEKSKPPPAPFKLKQFEAVKSKLSTHRPSSSNASDAASDSYSRPSTANSCGPRSFSLASNASSATRRNFIQLNALKAKDPQYYKKDHVAPASESGHSVFSGSSTATARSTKMGELPKYLVDRKLEWAEREQQRLEALKKECIPKGMKLLPDEERLETLAFLEETQQKLLNELSQFGLIVETTKLKNKRSMLENKLNEIEEAIGVFSRKKVYVNEDEEQPQ